MKKRRKSILTLLILLVLISTMITACGTNTKAPVTSGNTQGNNKPEITFRMNLSYSGQLYDTLMNEIAEKVYEYSDGRIEGQIVAAGTMGSESELLEALQYDTLDLAYTSDGIIDGLFTDIGWLNLPFMFEDLEEADAIMNYGWMRDVLNEKMLELGVVPIAVLENGFTHFASTVAPVEKLEDFKGQKVRVPQINTLVELYKEFGALPVTMPGSEVLSALEQGTIDAVNNTLFNFKQNGYIDAFKYITLTKHQYSACNISVSTGFWDSLSEEDKAIVKRAATEASDNYTNAIREGEKEIREEYEAKGIVFVDPSEELKAQFKVIRDKMWDKARKDADPKVMDRITNELGD